MSDKLQKRVCVAAGTTLAAALATLVHLQKVTGHHLRHHLQML